jgi:hypothetical protein
MALGEVVGKLYVERHFQEAKDQYHLPPHRRHRPSLPTTKP